MSKNPDISASSRTARGPAVRRGSGPAPQMGANRPLPEKPRPTFPQVYRASVAQVVPSDSLGQC